LYRHTPFITIKDDTIAYGYFNGDSFFIPCDENFSRIEPNIILERGILCPEINWDVINSVDCIYGLASFLENPSVLNSTLINHILGKSKISYNQNIITFLDTNRAYHN
jgi:hypothetical protein